MNHGYINVTHEGMIVRVDSHDYTQCIILQYLPDLLLIFDSARIYIKVYIIFP